MLVTKMQIAALVLQYGKPELTERCLHDLRLQEGVVVRIILVDGATPNLSDAVWQQLSSQADTALRLTENVGYAGGNNRGLAAGLLAEDEAVFIVNNDVELPRDCLAKLAAALHRHPKAAQIVPTVYYPDGTLQAAGGDIRQDLFEPRLIGNQEKEAPEEERQVRYAPGMAILVRRTALQEVGPLPEEYFLYGEDVDWSLRFAQAGYEIWHTPTTSLVHIESAGIGQFNQRKGYYVTRANVLLAKRWLSNSEWTQFLRRLRAKLLRQSVKWCMHPKYVLGMWQGYQAGVRGETGPV